MRRFCHKLAQGNFSTSKLLNFFDIMWIAYFKDGLAFIQVCLNALIHWHELGKKIHCLNRKGTLKVVEPYVVIPEPNEDRL